MQSDCIAIYEKIALTIEDFKKTTLTIVSVMRKKEPPAAFYDVKQLISDFTEGKVSRRSAHRKPSDLLGSHPNFELPVQPARDPDIE